MKRYGVGQASLRETARILEVQGIAAMYRGKGMLVASEPLAAAIRTLSIYLGLIGATVGEILEVRSAFGKLVSTLSTKRISSNQKREIKFALTKMGEATGFERMVYYSNLARILNESTGNPLLTLFQGAIEDFLPEETRLIEAFHHYDRIVAAFSAITEGRRDISVNYANEMALLEFEHDKARLAVRRPLQGQTDMPCDKLATTIASAMAMGITTAGMSPGERLGTEASLANYYGVARPTLRSAIRILSFMDECVFSAVSAVDL